MLLTKTITQQTEVQVEVKTPAFYGKPDSAKRAMLCDDGTILVVYNTYVSRVSPERYGYKSDLEETLGYNEISKDEFLTAYSEAITAFENLVIAVELPSWVGAKTASDND